MNGLMSVFESLGARADPRMTARASEEDLRRVETAVGGRVPEPLRTFLREVGSGLYEGGHEFFGPTRVMIHDIELVPDMMTMRARLGANAHLDPHLLPFHREGSTVHLVRTDDAGLGQVVSIPAGETWADVTSFVEQVVLRPSGDQP
jgi:SMI1/KNR4 family protein SUKH-1